MIFLRITGIVLMADTLFSAGVTGIINAGTLMPAFVGAVLLGYSWLRLFALPPWALLAIRGIAILSGIGLVSFLLLLAVILVHAFPGTPPDAEWIIVLGAGMHKDKPSATLCARMDTALAYLQAHPHTRAIVSGAKGTGETRSEAEVMREYLAARGLPPQRVCLEDKATSTFENLRYAKAIIDTEPHTPETRIGIVSSRFHLFRAGFLAKRAGIAAFTIPAPSPWYLLPNACLREYLAVAKSLLLDRA